jgi:hypothetical protein
MTLENRIIHYSDVLDHGKLVIISKQVHLPFQLLSNFKKESTLLVKCKITTKSTIEEELLMLSSEKRKDCLLPIMMHLEKLLNATDKLESMPSKLLDQE